MPPTDIAGQAIAARVRNDSPRAGQAVASDQLLRLRTRCRALQGMQKEALVDAGGDAAWRLLCDEGPWLNGTDLAPFPLAWFTAGLASCWLGDCAAELGERGLPVNGLSLALDNYFTMQGSALKGSMIAGVEPVRLRLSRDGDDLEPEIARSALTAGSCTAVALRELLPSRFAAQVNGRRLDWPGEIAHTVEAVQDPAGAFERAEPLDTARGSRQIVRKDEAAGAPGEPGQGEAPGLATEQKRQVHVHTSARLRPDGLADVAAQCIHPAGSRFLFTIDTEAGDHIGRDAPAGLVCLSAGLAFCFMTQLGRYAQISKQALDGYRLLQFTAFRDARAGEPAALPVDSFVFLDSREPAEKNLQLLRMGERTCYLHAMLRNEVPVLAL